MYFHEKEAAFCLSDNGMYSLVNMTVFFSSKFSFGIDSKVKRYIIYQLANIYVCIEEIRKKNEFKRKESRDKKKREEARKDASIRLRMRSEVKKENEDKRKKGSDQPPHSTPVTSPFSLSGPLPNAATDAWIHRLLLFNDNRLRSSFLVDRVYKCI